ncbi:unnamed protein product [Allacma fusca]|uniref:Prolyl 4-hydroxylase alpha subunit domain-containing protein n=1 Tax=Allacma fusca TaxID=39272 RepID=A0A8J2PF72_9HEXA|nr:unnamed protein product [Allacma fusca]
MTPIFLLGVSNLFASFQSAQTINQWVQNLEELDRFEAEIEQDLEKWLPLKSLSNEGNKPLMNLILKELQENVGEKTVMIHPNVEQKMSLQNPICAYKLIWRLKVLLEDILLRKSGQRSAGNVNLIRKFVLLSWENGLLDVNSSIENILMLQLIYDWDSEQISNGWISFQTKCSLNSLNCLEIATHAMNTKQHTFAITWLELAKRKALEDKHASIPFIEFALASAIGNHNKELDSTSATFLDDRFFSRKLRAHVPQDHKRVRRLQNIQLENNGGKRQKLYEKINYIGLCSGQNYQTEDEKSNLFCWLEFKLHPGLAIGPTKIELLARNPDILQIYEFIGDKETKKLALRSKQPTSATQNLSAIRRIEELFGLSFSAEALYFQSYPFGKYFLPGKDFMQPVLPGTVQELQLATLMIHLNDVGEENGGDTVFPYSGTTARPVKGSAVLWFNRLSDGNSDKNVVHGVCPIIFGNKLVAKFSIPFDKRLISGTCSLKQSERFQIPVNNMYFQRPKLPPPVVPKRQKPPMQGFKDKILKYSYITPSGLTDNYDILACLDDFEQSTKKIVKNLTDLPINDLQAVRKVALNPLAIYKVIGRFRNYYLPWTIGIPEPGNRLKTKLQSLLDKMYIVSGGPVRDDHEKALLVIANIQFIYDLEVKDVAAGLIDGFDARVTLNAKDSYLIGQKAILKERFTTGIAWLEFALHLVETKNDNSMVAEDVYNELVSAEIQHGEEHPKNRIVDYNFFVKPLSQTSDHSQRITHRSLYDQDLKKDCNIKKHYDNKLWQVCAGKIEQTPEVKSQLFCWYETEIHMTYKIGPIKAEIHSLSNMSAVIHYHDVLSARAVEEMKELINDKPMGFPHTNGKYDPFSSVMLNKVDIGLASILSQAALDLMSRITGYKKPPESRPIDGHYFVYGPGAARGRHLDIDSGPLKTFATFVFYLSNVEKGGETAFPRLRFKITPQKGSMLLWVNLYSDGILNKWIEHASCPVVFGEKWIFAPDAVEGDQYHLHCHLKRGKPYDVVVNGKPIQSNIK